LAVLSAVTVTVARVGFDSWGTDLRDSAGILGSWRTGGSGSECEDEEEDDVESIEDSVDRVEVDEAMSEWARVYLTVVMFSSRGVRNETRFSAGKRGRAAAILRGVMGLFARMELRLWGCL
jgi:hypothetical protein